ncbi:O-antigen ligase family protein [Nodularia spumigena CS-591/04]|uniref:O-antigen ligase family protein n=1 Tax=Nodularia spumigena TaxID=70799 RepID=UPI00232D3DE5|nr:O-antigen ligase family protein [Nodularia spumigena]MDB9323337.1 O-antigen ligase family protein [Nodularia spumigena CS-591/07A]MDB9330741.1 O-antigen ligase family protein [Nodularia spumigena CS-591/04]
MKIKIIFLELIDFLISLSACAILNIPSIKILYSSEVVNLSLLFIISILSLFQNRSIQVPSKNKLNFLKIWSLFWLLFLLYATFGLTTDILIIIIRYLSTYLYILCLILFVKVKHLPSIIYAQIVWGSFMSLGSFYGIFTLDRSLGQHYLTLGVPISASLCCILAFILKERQVSKLLLLAIPLFLNISVLFSLEGRAPIIFLVIVTILCLVMNYRFKVASIKTSLLKTMLISMILLFSLILTQLYLKDNTFLSTRFQNMFEDTKSEPRYFLYLESLTVLLKNPFGYGIDYKDLLGYYPHNIFIEVGLSTGIIGIILLCLLFKRLVMAFIKNSSSNLPCNFSISAMAVYLFLTWNVSFDLGSSYIPFGALAILITTTDDKQKK